MDVLVFADSLGEVGVTQLLLGTDEKAQGLILTKKEERDLNVLIYRAIMRTTQPAEVPERNDNGTNR